MRCQSNPRQINKMAGSNDSRKLFSSSCDRDLWSLSTNEGRTVVSPRPPSPRSRKSTDVVRMSKSEVERRESIARQSAEDNARLSSRVRRLEQDLHVLQQVEEDYRSLGSQVGVKVDSLSTETARAAIASAVNDALKDRESALQKLASASEQVTSLSGALAAERINGEGVSAELEQLRTANREQDILIKRQQEDVRVLRKTSANLSAQMESLRHRMASGEGEGGSAPRPIPVALQELSRLREEVLHGALEVGDLKDQLRAHGEQLELAAERATASQDALTELIEGLLEVLGMPVEGSTPEECVKQVAAVCQENTELRAVVSALEEEKAACEVGARANRETILRMVAEAREYESTLDKMTSLKQERDAAVACKVSTEHEKEELIGHLSRAQEQIAAAEKRLEEAGRHKDAMQGELDRLAEAMEKQREEFASLVGQIQTVTHCGSSEPGAALQELALKSEELQSVLGKMSSLKSLVQSQREELASIRTAVEERDGDVEKGQALLDSTKEELETCRANAALLEASLIEVKQALQVHVEFGMRLTSCLGLDEAVSSLLSGEFACDAVITRAQQLTRQETQALLEKQAIVNRLQQRLKVTKQALDSKDLHIGVLQKKIASLQERVTSYKNTQSRVDSLEKKLKVRCNQEEKLRSELARWSTAELDLKEREKSLWLLKDTVKARETTIASLQSTLGQLSKERDAAVKALDVLRVKGSKQRESLEQRCAGLETEMQACQDELGRLDKTKHQYASLRVGLLQALGMSQEEISDDQALVKATEQLFTALQKQEQRSHDLEASLRQLEKGFMLGLQDTLSQLGKRER